ncbi:MAG: hypothetical protein R6V85_13230 [Polyangia bacterium]
MSNTWKIAAGRGGKYAEDFKSLSFVTVGSNEMGDVTKIADRELLHKLHRENYPEMSKRQDAIDFLQLALFLYDMKPGDDVVSYNPGTREYFVGKIARLPVYRPELMERMSNQLPVKWLDKVKRDDFGPLSPRPGPVEKDLLVDGVVVNEGGMMAYPRQGRE